MKEQQLFKDHFKYRIWVVIVGISLLVACKDDEGIIADEEIPEKLISSTYLFSRSASELQTYIDHSGLDLPVEAMEHQVDFYKVEYTTAYKGSDVTASGVVMIPDTETEISTISFQHGTIAANRQAPTQLPLSDGQLILFQALASTGMITVAPDFIGFGASSEIMHPYYVEDLTASAVIDNIYAAQNLAKQLGLNVSERLYLAGYSQGGFATMATHKCIEEKGITGLELKASFPAAGGYDIKGVQDYFFEQRIYHQPFFLAYVAQAYSETFDWELDLSMFFNDPYASEIPGYFDGSLDGEQINNLLNDTLSVLLTPGFLNNSETDPVYATLYQQFEENSLLDWVPEIRMFMYHGDADFTVPYQNSVDTYNHFINSGAYGSIVTFTSLPGKNHGSGITPYIESFVSELLTIESSFK